MKTSRSVALVLACLIAVAAVAASNHVPKANTRGAVKSYVEEAGLSVQKNGPSCDKFASPNWRGGDYYIFVVGPDDKILCHPNKDMVGKLSSSIVNAEGVKVGQMISDKGKGLGQGWVEYKWARPGKTAEETKNTYVMGVVAPGGKHYVVGAGGFNLK